MKTKDSMLRIGIFYGLILAPTIAWLLLSAIGVAGALDSDTGEKRNKHQIAEETNLGNLTQELELTYNDYAPFRSALLKMNSALEFAVEAPYQGAILPGLTAIANAALGDKYDASMIAAGDGAGSGQSDAAANGSEKAGADGSGADGSAVAGSGADGAAADGSAADGAAQADASALTPYYETPVESGYYPYVELAPEVIKGRDGWLFRDESIPDYEGNTLQSDETLANIGGNIQALSDLCKSRGQEFYFLAIPNKNTVYPEYMPSIDKADYTGLKQLEEHMNNGSYDCHFWFLDDELLAAKKSGRLYYMTDTHWNGRGALACLSAIHPMLGAESFDPGALNRLPAESLVGDLIYYTGLPVESFPADETADYEYKPDIAVNQVRGGDDILDEFTSSAPDGRTLVYVGDSYRHHIMQYMNKDFAHTYFINCKQLTPEYADIIASADILLLENVERNFYINPDALNTVETLLGM